MSRSCGSAPGGNHVNVEAGKQFIGIARAQQIMTGQARQAPVMIASKYIGLLDTNVFSVNS